MHMLNIGGDRFRDKVLGCWIGKNCGGTLGTPIEEAWGRAEPFDIWWYPELQSGGLPNDDLEMQLVWLTALEQVGPELTAADLAPGTSGVRAQYVARDGSLVDDFLIREDDRIMHVLNTPSPAATASPAIGRMVAARAIERFGLA